MLGTYDLWLVILSVVVAVSASYVALECASRVAAAQGITAAENWLTGGAISMGSGIWSMHFIGMLAFRLPIPMSYDIPITLLSLLIAGFVAWFALYTVSRGSLSLRRLLAGGLLMGIGIAAMHYTGMAAMQMAPSIRYDPLLFSLSVLIAIVASVAALWIAFQLRAETILSAFWTKTGSALIMGAAISGMHYTGMAAANFAPDSVCTVSPQNINNAWLAASIGGFAFMFLATTLLVSVFDARLADRSARHAERLRQVNLDLEIQAAEVSRANELLKEEAEVRKRTEQALRNSERRFRALTENSSDAIVVINTEGITTYASPATTRILGYGRGERDAQSISEMVHPEDAAGWKQYLQESRSKPGQGVRFQCRVRHKDESWRVLEGVLINLDADPAVVGTIVNYHDVTDTKAYQEQLEHQATHDNLTGLANRALLRDRLHQAIAHAHRHGMAVAVACLDLDGFKLVNDSLGHVAGDDLLKVVAKRLTESVRETDTVARFGGDEFVIVLSDLKRREEQSAAAIRVSDSFTWDPELVHLLSRLLNSISLPAKLAEREVQIACSVGISVYPEHGTDAEALVKNADTALYRAKELGRGTFQFYRPEMSVNTLERLTLQAMLRRAVEQEEFVIHYQPKVSIDRKRVTGVEALVRWQSPEKGLVPPSEFIPALEDTGMIVDVGRLVLREAVAAWRRGAAIHPEFPRIAVNVSELQLRQRDFVGMVMDAIASPGGAVAGLDIEITESLIMKDIETNIPKLAALRALGIGIAVDDFGTGYSSLSYLAKLPITAMKIDRAFIEHIDSNPENTSLVTTIIALGHALRLTVVAEGVETEQQAKLLQLLRCDEMQGYLVARPMPFEQLLDFLSSGKI
ncbi:MAG: putative signaling protein [Steroidobacteraceae bacterium]|nr:putative signaling protein [Steroidobacteraceae bacterium]